jgi:hypothetical protein
MRQVVETGRLDDARREHVLLPFLDEISAAIARVSGKHTADLRLPLQSLVFLAGRYAIADASELCAVTGFADPSDAIAAVEVHLVDAARRLIGPATSATL